MESTQHPCLPTPSMKNSSYRSVSCGYLKLVTRNIWAVNKAFPVLEARIRPFSCSHSFSWLLWSLLRAELTLQLFSPSNHFWELHIGSPLGCTLFSWNVDEIYCHSHLCYLHLFAKFCSSRTAASQSTKGQAHICKHTNSHSRMHVYIEITAEKDSDFF